MTDTNLTKQYPLSARWVLLKILPWFLLLFASLYAVYGFQSSFEGMSLDAIYIKVFYIGIILIILRLLYLILFFSTITYAIKGDELYIVRGILFKKPVGVPITKINAIHIQRSVPEILFRLATLVIVVPGDIPTSLLSISGFSRANAEKLKAFIFTKN